MTTSADKECREAYAILAEIERKRELKAKRIAASIINQRYEVSEMPKLRES